MKIPGESLEEGIYSLNRIIESRFYLFHNELQLYAVRPVYSQSREVCDGSKISPGCVISDGKQEIIVEGIKKKAPLIEINHKFFVFGPVKKAMWRKTLSGACSMFHRYGDDRLLCQLPEISIKKSDIIQFEPEIIDSDMEFITKQWFGNTYISRGEYAIKKLPTNLLISEFCCALLLLIDDMFKLEDKNEYIRNATKFLREELNASNLSKNEYRYVSGAFFFRDYASASLARLLVDDKYVCVDLKNRKNVNLGVAF